MYLFIHKSPASSVATALASVAVSSVVANKVDAPVISAAYMPLRLLESPTAVAVYLISVGSMQHKLILPNSNGAHSVCSIHSTLQTIKSAITAIFHAFHNYYVSTYRPQMQLFTTINVIFNACYQYCIVSALARFYSLLNYDVCLTFYRSIMRTLCDTDPR